MNTFPDIDEVDVEMYDFALRHLNASASHNLIEEYDLVESEPRDLVESVIMLDDDTVSMFPPIQRGTISFTRDMLFNDIIQRSSVLSTGTLRLPSI